MRPLRRWLRSGGRISTSGSGEQLCWNRCKVKLFFTHVHVSLLVNYSILFWRQHLDHVTAADPTGETIKDVPSSFWTGRRIPGNAAEKTKSVAWKKGKDDEKYLGFLDRLTHLLKLETTLLGRLSSAPLSPSVQTERLEPEGTSRVTKSCRK